MLLNCTLLHAAAFKYNMHSLLCHIIILMRKTQEGSSSRCCIKLHRTTSYNAHPSSSAIIHHQGCVSLMKLASSHQWTNWVSVWEKWRCRDSDYWRDWDGTSSSYRQLHILIWRHCTLWWVGFNCVCVSNSARREVLLAAFWNTDRSGESAHLEALASPRF